MFRTLKIKGSVNIATLGRAAVVILCLGVLGAVEGGIAQERVSDTVHNLSASGPGQVRAQSEQQVCIFCHAPHNTGGTRPLWNREEPIANYTIYESSTLDANPGQPTGSSKLCLSCHDGTIALGAVLSRTDRIRFNGGDFMPAGLTNLGTDLSDDHPVSFYYTSGLAASDRQLADPATLPPGMRLDASGQLQCTSCHDAHNNSNGDFLVMANNFGALCTQCHVRDGWSDCAHRTSNAQVSGAGSVDWPHATVAENACRSCHRPHTAGGHERLLLFENEEDNCLNCHNGQVATRNIMTELDKFSAHDPRRYLGKHDPVEGPFVRQTHVECDDCHNAHAVSPQVADPGGYIQLGATLAMVSGVTLGGAPVEHARYEYEICFKCHADSAVPVNGQIVRQSHSTNLRLDFSVSNPSYHPIAGSSPGGDTVSLVSDLPPGSLIRCTDCHNNDTGPRAGGGGSDGPHGSAFPFLLERNYTTRDSSSESEYEYALCYKCHRQSSILGDESFSEHRRHIVEEHTPCSACHDPHGVPVTGGDATDRTHLINFDTTIVFPLPDTGLRQYRDLGTFAGSCTLVCHGAEHRNERYPDD